jgi:hypothetical protein
MVGGLYRGREEASAVGRSRFFASASRFFAKHALMIALVLAITILYRVSDVVGSPLAGESGYAFAALLPAVTMHRAGILRLKVVAPQPAPAQLHASTMTPEPSLS